VEDVFGSFTATTHCIYQFRPFVFSPRRKKLGSSFH